MEITQMTLPDFNGYIDVFDIGNPIPVTMEQITGNNPPMFVSLIVKNHIPKLENLNAFLINGQLPPNLIDLDCRNNSISSLPPLPEGMEYLSCDDNLITNLISLPPSLQYLYCNNNQLTSLPKVLPEDLVILSCNGNQLVSLPQLDNLENLMNLECSHNQLSNLPDLPENDVGLNTLNCSYNILQGLPNLPNNLSELNCSNNSIFALTDLPASLKKLNCSYNQINGLSVLPDTLEKLNISYNPIIGSISNIILPASLKKFYCHYCQITELPTTLPNSMIDFKCSNNSIISLPNLPNRLKRLNCSNNNLTVMPDLPDSLRELYCRGNNFDEQSINKIIAFYQRAIKNGFKPSFQEELDYFQINRSKTFINAFGQFPQGEKGQTVSIGPGIAVKQKPFPGKAMKNILEKADLPLPPGNLGGTKKRRVFKKKRTFKKRKTCKRKKTLKKLFK
jgi:Leucine-rich repeat (LRR) protein